MTKQLHSLPNLDTKSRQNFLALSKYSAQKKQRKTQLFAQPTINQITPRSMNSHMTGNITERDALKSTNQMRREDSRLAETGDDLNINTSRLNHEDKLKPDTGVLPPILDNVPSLQETDSKGEDKNDTKAKNTIKLPVASRYQLYSIGLTYNTGKEKKDRRTQKKPQTYREINNRRMRLKANNKVDNVTNGSPIKSSEDDVSFSIRKKIEQYRSWHEEQYRHKIRDFKNGDDRDKNPDFLKVGSFRSKGVKKQAQPSPSIKLSHRSNSYENLLPRIPAKGEHNVESVLKEEDEETINEKTKGKAADEGDQKATDENKNKLTKQPVLPKAERVSSSKTWRTWRDVNDSYAYTDVKQYIKENELMDEEKEKYIEEWIDEVGDPLENFRSPSVTELPRIENSSSVARSQNSTSSNS